LQKIFRAASSLRAAFAASPFPLRFPSMKNYLRHCRLPFLVPLLLWGSALGVSAATAISLSFNGDASGGAVGTPTRNPYVYSVALSGSGHGSSLGSFTLVAQHTTNGLSGAITRGSITFTGSNGDQLYGTYTGQESPTNSPDIVTAAGVITVTGGTGKFAKAKGTINFTTVVKVNEITAEGVYLETVDATFDGDLLILN
jgi:hypothetical protein